MNSLFDFLNEVTGNDIVVEPLKVMTTPSVTLKRKSTKKQVVVSVEDNTVELESLLDNDSTEKIADVRTERQKGRKVSYDVGEVIGGSRKQLRSLRERFVEAPSVELIEELENEDLAAAIELATKENVFGETFTIPSMASRDVEVNAAYAITLLLRRIPSNSTGLNRSDYIKAMLYVSEQLKVVKTFKELSDTLYRMRAMKGPYSINLLAKANENYKAIVENDETDPEIVARYKLRIQENEGTIKSLEYGEDFPIRSLGKFSELIMYHGGISMFCKNNCNKYESWEEYFGKKSSSKKGEKGTTRKPVWERNIPVEILRIGGKEVPTMQRPEDFASYFDFRAIECGHWMKDIDALNHLTNSAKAFVDLADLLGIEVNQISLGKDLAIAFGARGRSKASGHYERGYNVINFTKEKGSTGICAHEWFHAYDRYLKRKLAVTDELELMTELKNVHEYPMEVQSALLDLIQSFREGKSLDYFEINPNNSYRISTKSRDMFVEFEHDVTRFVDTMMEDYDKQIEKNLSGYVSDTHRESAAKRYANKRKKYLRTVCEVAAILRKEYKGEELMLIPYTVNISRFYNNALKLDRGTPKYWATDVELAARAFEAYINLKLKQSNRVSHYLVCGLDNYAYPYGSELTRISNAMDKFLQVTLPYLREEQ